MKLFSGTKYSRSEQVARLVHCLHKLKRSIDRADRQVDAPAGLAPVQRHIIMLLHTDTVQTMSELAEALCVSKSAATQLLDTMVESGLVERYNDPHDRRVVRLRLTKKSRKYHKAAYNHAVQMFTQMFEALDDDELARYVDLTEKVVAGHQAKNNIPAKGRNS